MLPSFAKLRLDTGRRRRPVSTGEFYPLSADELEVMKDDKEALTLEEFQLDADFQEDWHTFRVRSEFPRADGTYDYKYYRGESLWEHVKRGNLRDPITRGPIWYEDYMDLHNRFAPGQPIPVVVMQQLRRRDVQPETQTPAPPAAPAHLPPQINMELQVYWARIASRAADGMQRNAASASYVWDVRNARVPVPTVPLNRDQFWVISETIYEYGMSIKAELNPSTRPSYAPRWFTEIGEGALALLMNYGTEYMKDIPVSDQPAEYARFLVKLIVALMEFFVRESTRENPDNGIVITNFLGAIKVAWNNGVRVNADDDTDYFSLNLRNPADHFGGNATRNVYVEFQRALKEWYDEVVNYPRRRNFRPEPPTTLMDETIPPAYVGESGVIDRSKVFERKEDDGSSIEASPDLLANRLSRALAYMISHPNATLTGVDAGARQAIEHFLVHKAFYERFWVMQSDFYSNEREIGVRWNQRLALTLLAMQTFGLTGSGSNSEHWREFQRLLVQCIAQMLEFDAVEMPERLVAEDQDGVRMFVNQLLVWKDEHWQLRRGDVVTDRPWQAATAVLRTLDPTALTPPPAVIAPYRQYTQPIEDEEMPQFLPISGDNEPPSPQFLNVRRDDDDTPPRARQRTQLGASDVDLSLLQFTAGSEMDE